MRWREKIYTCSECGRKFSPHHQKQETCGRYECRRRRAYRLQLEREGMTLAPVRHINRRVPMAAVSGF